MTRTLRLFWAFVRRDAAAALSYRVPFALELVSILFSLALFYYLSRLVGASATKEGGQLSDGYFAFAVIGLAMLRIVTSGLTSFAQRLRDEQTTGTLEALLTTPAPPSVLVLGTAAYDLLRATVSAGVLILVGVLLFGLRFEASAALLLVPVAVIGALALFAALGVALAAFTIVYKQTTGALAVMVPGVSLLAGVYFPIKLLPEPLHTLAAIFPFTWALDVLRSALLIGDSKVGLLVALLAAAAVALPAALALFRVSLRRARRDGSLAQY
jgi:ABC-2 type transport system permease protein